MSDKKIKGTAEALESRKLGADENYVAASDVFLEVVAADILAAPCIVCGYKGEGYWQAGTHSQDCPFSCIGGIEDRSEYLSEVLGQALKNYYMGYSS